MDNERFISAVERRAHLTREDAERAVQATLETLAERLPKGEVRQLVGQLPIELSP